MRFSVLSCALLASLAGVASAGYTPGVALIDPGLSGNTQYDGWIDLVASNYPGYGGFPGSGAWPAPIGSNRTTGNAFDINEPGDAGLIKTANGNGGGAYPAGGSLYFGGFSSDINNNGGSLAVVDSTPVANLSNVVFQIQIGEAWTFDFLDEALPTLSYNGGAQSLVAGTSLTVEKFHNGTVTMPSGEEDVFINTYLLQWDLSGVVDPITEIQIDFVGVQHAQLYGLQLNQSDVFTLVPAPGAIALLSLGGLVATRRRR